MAYPAQHIIEPTEPHTLTAILLAGRGASPQEFAEEVEACFRFAGCKWVILGACDRPTVFGDEPEWFDLASTSSPNNEEERQISGLRESVLYVRSIVEQERAILPLDKILFGGISQGFAVAAHVLLSSGYRFGGFVGMCGWLPLLEDVRRVRGEDVEEDLKRLYTEKLCITFSSSDGIKVPALIMHSRDDTTIDVENGRRVADAFERVLGMGVDYQEFEHGEHEIKEPEGPMLVHARLDSMLG